MNGKRLIAIALALALLFINTAALATNWVAVVTKKSTVYASASTSARVLGTIAKNKILALKQTKGGWAEVELNGKVGYMNASNIKQTTLAMYVSAAAIKVYASNSASSRVLSTFPYGTKVNLQAVNGDWARIVSGDNVGYVKYSSLTSKNPNTLNLTVYTQAKGVKVYAAPSTSAKVISTLGANYQMKCVAICGNDTWCRVYKGGNYGYILKSNLGTSKYDGYSTALPASGRSVSADWWKSKISTIFAKGDNAIVTDVKTGITWRVYRGGGTNHADVQPLTASDTRALKKACGSDYNTWARRAIWVSVGGKKYAASMNCKPHGDGSITDNNYDGHFCIHFTNSRTHSGNSLCSLHQACIKKALAAG